MPREYKPDAIEVFNTKGPDGDGFINIHMPIEAAKEMASCFDYPDVTNAAVAERLYEAIAASEDDRNYQGWVIKE